MHLYRPGGDAWPAGAWRTVTAEWVVTAVWFTCGLCHGVKRDDRCLHCDDVCVDGTCRTCIDIRTLTIQANKRRVGK